MDLSRAAPLRVVIDGSDRPALQIARDLALLMHGDGATLRLYGFRPAGLTLGRFQSAADFADVDAPHEVVRRPTGGGAIFHDDDITYALTIDDDPARSSDAWYDLIHGAIAGALSACGIRALRSSTAPRHPGPRAEGAKWCFAQACRGDLIAPGGGKLCGSAQRRLRRPRARLLQHGSVVMRRSPVTPFCAAVADQVDANAARVPLIAAIAQRIAAALGLEPVRGTRTGPEELAALGVLPQVLPDNVAATADATR
ncbi:MAG: hypothetical protein HZB39_20325 [Planctomycetes bacterium]|nr:hypothetical protein [Planctomycetota bacterium]